MDEAAARLRADGLKMDYYFCTDFEPQQILSILDYLKDTQIDGIALRGLLNKTIIERVNEFIDRGIPGCQITGTWQQNCHFDRLQLLHAQTGSKDLPLTFQSTLPLLISLP